MGHPIVRPEATIIKHLLDSKDFPITGMRNMLTDLQVIRTATTAIRMITSKWVTVRMAMDKKVMANNSKAMEGTNTVMEDTAVIILTLDLLLSNTSRREFFYLFLLSLVVHS